MADYFSTQNLISQFDEDFKSEIFDNSLLIVGLGGNGTHIALSAARMGFRRIIGIDKDIVSDSNLSRQILYTTEDIGISKASAALKNLSSHNLVSNISTHNFDILIEREHFANLVQEANLVFIALDQPGASFFAIDTCFHFRKPTIVGGTCTMSGLVSRFGWMAPYQRPCLNCNLPIHSSMSEWVNFYKFSSGKVKFRSQEVNSIDAKLSLEGGHPSMYPTACIGSNFMIVLALNYFMGNQHMSRMLELSILDFSFQKIEIKENLECPTCSSNFAK
jgi:molybdopterin/thiamine biosynthesis adenylyltransferase